MRVHVCVSMFATSLLNQATTPQASGHGHHHQQWQTFIVLNACVNDCHAAAVR